MLKHQRLSKFRHRYGSFIHITLLVFLLIMAGLYNPVHAKSIGTNRNAGRNNLLATPTITAGATTGSVSACAGSASVSPDILQFSVSGTSLTANITATAPANFQVSLSPGSGYAASIILTETSGSVTNVVVYVRAAATAPTGAISGNVALASTGATAINVAVTGTINALPTVNAVSNQTVNNGSSTTAVNYAGTANTYNWVNKTPSIGLPASGTGVIPSFIAVNNGASAVTATITATPLSTNYAYIANSNAQTVSVVDMATRAIVTNITVGGAPEAVAVSPDGTRVYVTNLKSVSVINTLTNTVIATIPTSSAPASICVSPDNSKVYIVLQGYPEAVSVINATTYAVLATITVGTNPDGIAISPDGSHVYVTDDYTGNVSVISTATNTVTANVALVQGASDLVVTPDGSRVYVANGYGNSVSVISTATNTVLTTISNLSDPEGIAISPNGAYVYCVSGTSHNVTVISTATNTPTATIPVGNSPQAVSVTADGALVCVVNTGANNISLISTATNAVVASVTVGTQPRSFGNFIRGGTGCDGSAKTFTITIDPTSTPTPVIDTASSLAALTTIQGVPSASESFTVAGTNMKAGILVTPPAGYEVSTDNSTFSSTVTAGAAGTVNATVYIRLAASAATGTYLGNVVLSSTGANSVTVGIAPGTVNTDPAIYPNPVTGSIITCAGTASANPNIQQFSVFAYSLLSTITVTAPAGFQVSHAPGSGYSSSITLLDTNGVVNEQIVYVRAAANAAAGNITGNVMLTSTSAATQTVAVTATVNAPPTMNAVTNQTVANEFPTTAINFTGSGAGYDWVNDTPGIGLAASGNGNIPSFTAINTGSSAVTATITATPIPVGFDGYAYIVNTTGGSVSVVSIVTNQVVATIQVAASPYGVAVSPDGTHVYVTSPTSNTVSVISTATNTVVATITGIATPENVVVSPDGTKIYVTNLNSTAVSVISAASNSVTTTFQAGSTPSGIAISPDGSKLYVVNTTAQGTITVINTATGALISTIGVGSDPFDVAVTPDGTRAYVPNHGDGTVSVINTATNTVVTTITTGYITTGLAISPDGSKVYLANSSSIAVIATATNTILTNITGVGGGDGVAVSADGSRLFAENGGANNISVINTSTYATVATVPVGAVPDGVGNFTSISMGCSGKPVTFTVTVNPGPAITAGKASGIIFACLGTASVNPNIESFTVKGTKLTAGVTATAPAGFEVSVTAASGYAGSVVLPETGGTLTDTVVYVRSAASATGSSISGNVTLSSTNANSQTIAVSGIINPLPTGNAVTDQTIANGNKTTAITFSGTANAYNWTNSTPSIGLAASGKGNIPAFTAINTGTTPVTATITATPSFTGFAYVTNGQSNTVSVINTATNVVMATIPVGQGPSGAAPSPDGSRVYVVNSTSYSISVINTATELVIATIPIPAPYYTPVAAVVSPDGATLYVAVDDPGAVLIINTATNTITGSVLLGKTPQELSVGAKGIAMSADGTRIYTASPTADSVYVINTSTKTRIASIAVGSAPQMLALSPDGTKLFVPTSGDDSFSVISTATNTVIATVEEASHPGYFVVSPDNKKFYLEDYSGSVIGIGDATTYLITSSITGLASTNGMSLSLDGSTLYVCETGAAKIVTINTATNAISGSVAVGTGPSATGNFVAADEGCSGAPIKFTVTVDPGTAPAVLSGLKISNGTLSPVFTSTTNNYTASVANGVTSIKVTPTASPAGSTITVNGVAVSSGAASAAIPLAVGANTITIAVTAQGGSSTNTYTITVTRAPSSNANLSLYSINRGTLKPAFSTGIYSYTASVANGIAIINVTPTSASTAAAITVNGEAVASGKASQTIPLTVGANTITTVVTAQDGVTTKTYTLVVTEAKSSNANLAGLKPGIGALSPAFSPTTTSYTENVANTVTSITLTPTTAVSTSTVTVRGIAVTSGTASQPIALSVGANTIKTIVKAQDEVTSQTYTLTVTRAAAPVDSYVPIAIGTGVGVTQSADKPSLEDDIIFVHQGVSPNGDGINDFLVIDGIQAYPDNKLTIMNRSGQLIYQATGYDNTSKVFDGHSNKNGQMQLPGTYFYELDYTVKGVTKTKTGFLVLKY